MAKLKELKEGGGTDEYQCNDTAFALKIYL